MRKLNTAVLISKLAAIEQALSEGASPALIRMMLVDVQDYAVQLDREATVSREETQGLRDLIEAARRSSLFRLSTPRVAATDGGQMDEDPAESGTGRCVPNHRVTFVN